MAEANYSKRVASLCIDTVLDAPFVADAALCEDAAGPVRRFFARVVHVSALKKAYLLVDLAARFVAVWKRIGHKGAAAAAAASSSLPQPSSASALCFVDELVQLMTMREHDAALHHRADDDAHATTADGGEEEPQAGPDAGPPIVR